MTVSDGDRAATGPFSPTPVMRPVDQVRLSIVQAIVNRYDGMASLRNRDDGQTGIVASVGFIAVP